MPCTRGQMASWPDGEDGREETVMFSGDENLIN